jgi:hypothetical protein
MISNITDTKLYDMKFKIYKTPMTILPTSVQNLITDYPSTFIEYVSFCYIVFGIISLMWLLAEFKCADFESTSSVL